MIFCRHCSNMKHDLFPKLFCHVNFPGHFICKLSLVPIENQGNRRNLASSRDMISSHGIIVCYCHTIAYHLSTRALKPHVLVCFFISARFPCKIRFSREWVEWGGVGGEGCRTASGGGFLSDCTCARGGWEKPVGRFILPMIIYECRVHV